MARVVKRSGWGVVRRGVVMGCASAAALLAGAPPSFATSCVSSVVVEGRMLFGAGIPDADALPARAEEIDTIEPGCDELDERGTAVALRGIPATVAVLDVAERTLYVRPGSLTQSPAHPLHNALNRHELAARGCHPIRRKMIGIVVDTAGSRVDIRVGPQLVGTDANTRIVNRPAYAPLLPDQRVRLSAARCSRGAKAGPGYRETHTFARRIWFAGPTPTDEQYEPNLPSPLGISWGLLLGLLGFVALVAVITITTARRHIQRTNS